MTFNARGTNYLNMVESIESNKEYPDLEDFSVEELIKILTVSANPIPPRRGLKDRTYRQILIKQVNAARNGNNNVRLKKVGTKRQQKRYDIKKGVDAMYTINM